MKELKPINRSLLYKYETRIKEFVVPLIPKWITSRKLTMSTLFFGFFVFISYLLARNDKNFLFLASVFIILQYMTDVLDGAVGRYRKEGLVNWGFYMDHLLDFIFVCFIIGGWYFLLEEKIYTLLIIILIGLFFINSLLKYGVFKEFTISVYFFSATELRLVILIFNTTYFFISQEILLKYFFIPSIIFGFLILIIDVYLTQKKIFHK